MALTLAEATDEVRDMLNEPNATFWSDAEIQQWIKEGTRVLSSKGLLVEADDDITLVANQLFYTSSDAAWIGDALEAYAAIYDDQSNNYKGLVKITPKQLGNVATFTSGDPKYYCFFNRTFYIWPLTTAAIVTAGGTVRVLYGKETDDITELHDEYQHLPIMYACSKCKQKDQKFAEANAFMTMFYQELNFERADKFERETDGINEMKLSARGQNK